MTQNRRTRVRQLPERGSTDWAAVESVLDSGFLAQVGFCVDSQPFVIPMLYARCRRSLFLHGASAGRLMSSLSGGIAVCVGVTLIDGLVLARSAFHHSMNYRSVVAFGTARAIVDAHDRVEALRSISEHLLPGRWADVRGPNKRELERTSVLEMSIEEASAKCRTGPVCDEPGDYRRKTWAGVLPMTLGLESPIPDECLEEGIQAPDYLRRATNLFSSPK